MSYETLIWTTAFWIAVRIRSHRMRRHAATLSGVTENWMFDFGRLYDVILYMYLYSAWGVTIIDSEAGKAWQGKWRRRHSEIQRAFRSLFSSQHTKKIHFYNILTKWLTPSKLLSQDDVHLNNLTVTLLLISHFQFSVLPVTSQAPPARHLPHPPHALVHTTPRPRPDTARRDATRSSLCV